MHEALVNAHQLRLDVPESNRTVEGRGHESLLVSGMPFAVGDCRYVTLGVCHVLDVHIASDSHLKLASILVIDSCLVVCCATEEPRAIWIE